MTRQPLTAQPRTPYRVGTTARTSGRAAIDGPLRHAATRVKASATGRNVRALCGTSIRPAGDRRALFTGEHPRDCRDCLQQIRDANGEEAR